MLPEEFLVLPSNPEQAQELYNLYADNPFDLAGIAYNIRVNPERKGLLICGNQALNYPHLEKYTYPEWKKEYDKEQVSIGYKTPKSLFRENIKEGTVYVKCGDGLDFFWKPIGYVDDSLFRLPEDIVTDWEAVYEEKSVEKNFGIPKRKFKITKNTVTVTSGSNVEFIFSDTDVKELTKRFDIVRFSLLDTYPTALQIGCKDGTALTYNEIKEIIEIQNNL